MIALAAPASSAWADLQASEHQTRAALTAKLAEKKVREEQGGAAAAAAAARAAAAHRSVNAWQAAGGLGGGRGGLGGGQPAGSELGRGGQLGPAAQVGSAWAALEKGEVDTVLEVARKQQQQQGGKQQRPSG